MNYLVIGNGGREHAIYWRLKTDGSAERVYVAPGNGGIEPADCVAIGQNDFAAIAEFCTTNSIDMVVVGPEAPLSLGITDYLEAKGIAVFGPSKAAAQLEASKLFAKHIMKKYGVPTAAHHEFTHKNDLIEFVRKTAHFPMVIKLDGLAAGKGVGIPNNLGEALLFIEENVREGVTVFVEDFITGEEASILGISDGYNIFPFIAAQDHKRVFDGDEGPNTGGMGAYAPAPVANTAMLERVRREVLQPVIDGMRSEGIIYKGILYAGMMIDSGTISVLEFNARFGDPETQVLLPLLNGKLGDLFWASVKGGLTASMLSFKDEHCLAVVMASKGYPGEYPKGIPILGLKQVSDGIVFHAGTKRDDGQNILTDGGRVLAVSAKGDTLQAAHDLAYNELKKVSFDGAHYRTDIGHRAL